MNDEFEKITPYQKLQSLLSENDRTLSDKANDNINTLLGIEDKPSIWDKVKAMFDKIDGLVFSKSPKINSRYQKRK